MTKQEVEEAMEQVKSAALLIRMMPDFTAYIEASEHSLEVAPYLDPTAWLKGSRSLQEWVEVARAVRECKQKLDDIYERALQREARKVG